MTGVLHLARCLLGLAVCFAAAVSVPPVRACEDIDPLLAVPGDGTCAGVVPDGEPQTASTYEELTGIIDGAAALYDQYGFVAAAFQNYAVDVGGTPAASTLSLFNQGSSAQAAALFDDPSSGSGTAVEGWGGTGAARMRVAFGVTTLEFHEACFFGRIVVLSGEAAAATAARCLGEAAAGMVHAEVSVSPPSWGAVKAMYR